MFSPHQPENTCPSTWHRLTLIERMGNKGRREVVRERYIKIQQNNCFYNSSAYLNKTGQSAVKKAIGSLK